MMIRFENVHKSFGSHQVLKGISLDVPEGQILFILGTSGTGKSVLLKNVVGLMKPDAGEIWIDGEPVSKLDEEELFPIRRKCGMVFQNPALFDSLSVFDNVAYGLRKHFPDLSATEVKERVRQCLALVHIQDIDEKLPQAISFGMQKRVSLARTIAINPKILLFDEPTTGLDPITTRAINGLIFDLSRKLKTTSIVISHDMYCALEIADRIVVMDQGLIVAEGTPKEMKSHKHPLVRDFLSEALSVQSGH